MLKFLRFTDLSAIAPKNEFKSTLPTTMTPMFAVTSFGSISAKLKSSRPSKMNDKKQWGGKRIPGEGKSLGRPSTLQNPVRVTIWLEAEQLAWVKSQGEQGEVIRRLIDEARNDTAK